jgi:hypothetical protein
MQQDVEHLFTSYKKMAGRFPEDVQSLSSIERLQVAAFQSTAAARCTDEKLNWRSSIEGAQGS